ncbi:hypothetical protein WA026_012649 [Henosepilachna vigintioctopunctata]|uniref:Endonuclease/exonuclease/phosphatase domain-containing protein n=1 Tax=Henosepilachna vigintioctopunctata TaxID=420089 RepID=A0AAW1U1F0_9CUCU
MAEDSDWKKFFVLGHDVVCGGDTNIDFFNFTDLKTSKLNKVNEYFNFKQIVDSATTIPKSSSTLIDIILLPYEVENYRVDVDSAANISDHMLVNCELNLQIEEPLIRTYKSRELQV